MGLDFSSSLRLAPSISLYCQPKDIQEHRLIMIPALALTPALDLFIALALIIAFDSDPVLDPVLGVDLITASLALTSRMPYMGGGYGACTASLALTSRLHRASI